MKSPAGIDCDKTTCEGFLYMAIRLRSMGRDFEYEAGRLRPSISEESGDCGGCGIRKQRKPFILFFFADSWQGQPLANFLHASLSDQAGTI